jgi:hypothetical protein
MAYVSFYAGFVDGVVQVVCGDAGPDLSCRYVQHFSAQSASFAHAFNAFCVKDRDVVPSEELLF